MDINYLHTFLWHQKENYEILKKNKMLPTIEENFGMLRGNLIRKQKVFRDLKKKKTLFVFQWAFYEELVFFAQNSFSLAVITWAQSPAIIMLKFCLLITVQSFIFFPLKVVMSEEIWHSFSQFSGDIADLFSIDIQFKSQSGLLHLCRSTFHFFFVNL